MNQTCQRPESRPRISVVIPFYNEEENVVAVCEEIRAVLEQDFPGGWEVLMVNDGSKDGTARLMNELAGRHAGFRALHLVPNSSQSAALEAGFRRAKGELLVMMDGDGQNDPRDLKRLVDALEAGRFDMMCGIRARRADNWVRRVSSRLANGVRARILGDRITDVGCSLRVFRRRIIRDVGFFRHAHRFFPALVIMRGFRVGEIPVGHRGRLHGTSRYGGGINSRLWVGLLDLAGVWWLKKRALRYRVQVVDHPGKPRP